MDAKLRIPLTLEEEQYIISLIGDNDKFNVEVTKLFESYLYQMVTYDLMYAVRRDVLDLLDKYNLPDWLDVGVEITELSTLVVNFYRLV